jgi:hypothetical protein
VQQQPDFIRALILKAVRRYITDALQSRSLISAHDCAAEILATYPACDLPLETVTDEVIMAAAKAGVPVESGPSLRASRHAAS